MPGPSRSPRQSEKESRRRHYKPASSEEERRDKSPARRASDESVRPVQSDEEQSAPVLSPASQQLVLTGPIHRPSRPKGGRKQAAAHSAAPPAEGDHDVPTPTESVEFHIVLNQSFASLEGKEDACKMGLQLDISRALGPRYKLVKPKIASLQPAAVPGPKGLEAGEMSVATVVLSHPNAKTLTESMKELQSQIQSSSSAIKKGRFSHSSVSLVETKKLDDVPADGGTTDNEQAENKFPPVVDPGWCRARFRGKKGVVPEKYFRPVEIGAGRLQTKLHFDGNGTHEYVICKAIATFKARHHDEISFLKGDEMELFVEQPEAEDQTDLVSRVGQTALISREPGPEHDMLPSTLATWTRNAFALGSQDYMGAVVSERAGPSPAPSEEWCFDDNSFHPGHAPLQQSLGGFEPPNPTQMSDANQLTPHDIAALVNIAAISRLYKHKDRNANSAAPAEHSTSETLPPTQKDGFLERIALDEGGATSKSPRTLPDEVYHCYMLGKSMQDLWVPPAPENIAFQSQGWKSGDMLRSSSETVVDEDELQHYYQIGKSVQEMWARGYDTNDYGRPELAHTQHSNSCSIALPTQAAIKESDSRSTEDAGPVLRREAQKAVRSAPPPPPPAVSEGANRKFFTSGRKLLPDIQEMLSHGSGADIFSQPSAASNRTPSDGVWSHGRASEGSAPVPGDRVPLGPHAPAYTLRVFY